MTNADVTRLFFPDNERPSGVCFLHQTSVKEMFPRHTHDFYEFFYVLQGKAIHHINGCQMLLSQGTLVLIRPQDIHYYSFFNQHDMETISIGVDCSLVEATCSFMGLAIQRFAQPDLPLQIVCSGGNYWMIADKLLCLEKKVRGQERRQYFLSLLPELLYQMQFSHQPQAKLIPPWLSRLASEMNERENFIEGLPRMIQLSGVSQEHLNRAFKKYFELTPTAFINMKRVDYGAALLLEGKTSILDICYLCGFNNLSYFYRVFEGIYHCTPRQFIQERSDTGNQYRTKKANIL